MITEHNRLQNIIKGVKIKIGQVQTPGKETQDDD